MHFLVRTVLATGSKSFLITSFSYETRDDDYDNMAKVMAIKRLLDKYDDYHDTFQILNKEDISLHKNRDSIREVNIQIFNITIIIIIIIIITIINKSSYSMIAREYFITIS